MKAIRTSLLLLLLFFSFGTFAQAQFPEEPCTRENIEGEWLETIRSRFEDVIWIFEPDLFRVNRGVIGCISDGTDCSNIYPGGNPLSYILESGNIIITWSRTGFDRTTYRCFRVGDQLNFLNFDESPSIFEFSLLDGLGNGQTESVPTLSEWGLIAMAGVLGIVGFMVIRRKKVTS